MSLPPQPWTFTADSYTGEVTLRDAAGKSFLTIPAQAEMVEAKHAVGLVKRRWRMEGAEELARAICAVPALAEACRAFVAAPTAPDGQTLAHLAAAIRLADSALAPLDILE